MPASGLDEVARSLALVECRIEPDAVKSGPEEARVKRYGVHVWALLNRLTTSHFDRQAAARADEVPDEAIDAILAYDRLRKRALDAGVALVPSDDPMPRATHTNSVEFSE